MSVAGILFDKDGTLFDFQASWSQWAFKLIHELAGQEPARAHDLADRVGYDLMRQAFRPDSLSIAGTVADQADALLPGLPGWTRADLIRHLSDAAASAEMAPVRNLRGILDDLRRRGLVLGVATNDAEAAALRHLDRAGITDAFAFVAGFDSGFGAKPEPGMCHAFSKDQGLDPADVLMVGDSTHDLIAGHAAGMSAIGVLTGMATREDLVPFADAVMPDISHLGAWLDTDDPETDNRGRKATRSVAI